MKNNRHFFPHIDGQGDNAILCVPYKLKVNRIWAVVLRGRVSPPHYNRSDEATLMALASYAMNFVSREKWDKNSFQKIPMIYTQISLKKRKLVNYRL